MDEDICWFPRLVSGAAGVPARHVDRLVAVSWLMMTELFAYLEDVEGADDDAVLQVLAIRMAELAADIDGRLRGELGMDEIHQLPLVLEYGFSEVAQLDGTRAAPLLGLANSGDGLAAGIKRAERLKAVYQKLVDSFPGDLFNTLLPQSQGQTLRTLRGWNKLCSATGTDAAFLAPLMRAL